MDPRLEEVTGLPGASGPIRRFLDKGIQESINRAIAQVPPDRNWLFLADTKKQPGSGFEADIMLMRRGDHWSVASSAGWKQGEGAHAEFQVGASW